MKPGEAERRLAELRRSFDDSFAAPPPPRDAEATRLLVLRFGGQLRAVALSDIAGLYVDRPVVPVPARPPGMLGIVGLLGRPVFVHDLGEPLGVPPAQPSWRWLAEVAGPASIAFPFEAQEQYLEATPGEIEPVRKGAGERAPAHVVGFVRRQGEPPIAVVDLAAASAPLRAPATVTDREE